ncbi:MAG: hypothetical protein U0791_20320 [Gemmataceae bacterium]
MTLVRLLPRFRKAYRELAVLETREQWSRGEIESHQLERLNSVWSHAIVRVPRYRRLAKQESLPPRFASLEEFRTLVPVLPKSLVQSRPRDFLADDAPSGAWKSTSGSTGDKTAVYWAADAYRESLRCKYRFLASWNVDIFDRIAFLWGRAATYKSGVAGLLARVRMPVEDWLRNRIRLPAYRLGPADLRRHLHRIGRFRPAAIYGYSTAVDLLAREAGESGFVCDSLRVAILTSELTSPQMVGTVEKALGVPAVSEYGSVECGLLACEGPDRTLRVREDVTLLESRPRDDGRHDILVTVLNNPAFPLLRYVIGDVTDAPIEFPKRGFAKLANLAGRDNDLILTPSGQPRHCTSFNHIFEAMPGIRCWQVHQSGTGAVVVRVEPTDARLPLERSGLEERIREVVEGYPVRLEIVPTLPRTLAGKHRWIVSEMLTIPSQK